MVSHVKNDVNCSYMAFLIDKYLPHYNYNEIHKRVVNAGAKKCFTVTKNMDMGKSFITKTLLKLRGLPTHDLKLQEFLKNICFNYLEEDPPHEFVIDASRGDIMIFWNFYFKSLAENKTVVTTETRILCLTKKSKFLFSIYWFFIKPFSGITRLEMLRLIMKNAESKR